MRNTNWTMIGLALCVLAVLFYFMKKSDFMKPKAVMETELATSMEVDDGKAEPSDMESEELTEEDDDHGDNEFSAVVEEEEVD